MTTPSFAEVWKECAKGDGENDARRRTFLIDPTTHGLLTYCRAVVQEEPDLPTEREVLQVFRTDWQRALAHTHLESVRLARERQWISDTVESAALAKLHAKLSPEVPAHLPVAFLRDLLGEILCKPLPVQRSATVVFPLVWEWPNGETAGKLVQFGLD